ncbi:MAG: ATP-grasp domain-containing protein [Deltaproteobacteria bacterium]|nr:ATP-grasp domain-containing protein [Deltaproteobacteria bacterium]
MISVGAPTSLWGPGPPTVDDIDGLLGWPVFVKGARQTSRHRASLHIAEGPDAYRKLLELWRHDPILHWQTVVCRKYLRLRRIDGDSGDRVPPAFELRAFFWRGQLAGLGRYWWDAPPYQVTPKEESDAVAIASEAARRLDVPFLVVDVGQDVDGRWWVIECNDAQEAGHAGVSPFALWQAIVSMERGWPSRGA